MSVRLQRRREPLLRSSKGDRHGRCGSPGSERRLGAVVPQGIEHALRVQHPAQIAVGEDHAFLVVERAGDHFAPGRLDDRRAPTAEDISVRKLEREVVG